jgi:hypothetical protein
MNKSPFLVVPHVSSRKGKAFHVMGVDASFFYVVTVPSIKSSYFTVSMRFGSRLVSGHL